MGIGNITSTNSMSSMQMLTAASSDPKIKTIQNEITDAKQQIQKLSSKEELSVNEKTNERKKLQKEISDLNTELKQHQEELRKSQKREIMLANLQEDESQAKEETSEDKIQTTESSINRTDEKKLPTDKQQTEQQETVISRNGDGVVVLREVMNPDGKHGVDTKKQTDETQEEDIAAKETKAIDSDMAAETGMSRKEMHAIVSADSSVQQAGRQGTIIAKTRDGIAILKGEMKQDEKRDINPEKKLAELEKMEKREQRAIAFQFSILGEANNTMKSAAEADAAGIKNNTVRSENNAFINAMKVSQEDVQSSQQRFYVSFSH